MIVRREIPGFILNRLQAALVCEAVRLYEDGVASAEDIDKTVRDGLGLRWSFMGPMETIDLNAPGGVADYAARYGATMVEMNRAQTPRDWDAAALKRLETERRSLLGAGPARRARRVARPAPDGARRAQAQNFDRTTIPLPRRQGACPHPKAKSSSPAR